MKKRTTPLLIIFLYFFIPLLQVGQDIGQLKNVDISNLSDDQIESYWSSIQKKGVYYGAN